MTGIENAYEKGNVQIWGLEELGCTPAEVGEAGSPTRVVSPKRKIKDRQCEFLTGAGEELAETLVRKLIERGLIG